jgi:hypothetical protein
MRRRAYVRRKRRGRINCVERKSASTHEARSQRDAVSALKCGVPSLHVCRSGVTETTPFALFPPTSFALSTLIATVSLPFNAVVSLHA